MDKFTIIEDCSPYYIRFTHDRIKDLIEYCKKCIPSLENKKWLFEGFIHHKLSLEQAEELLMRTPISNLMPLNQNRVSLFISKPGIYYRAHKDGLNHRFSINYTIQIADDKCVTSWYCDDDLKHYPIDYLGGNSRECKEFNPKNHTPLKSMIAKPGECILFNTDLFHDWDNSQSDNYRIILTLRMKQPNVGQTYFEDAKKIIFESGTQYQKTS
jgi:hypothetical protein